MEEKLNNSKGKDFKALEVSEDELIGLIKKSKGLRKMPAEETVSSLPVQKEQRTTAKPSAEVT